MSPLSTNDTISTETGMPTLQEAYWAVTTQRPRLAVYVAHDSQSVSTDLMASLQRFCGRDVAIWTRASAAQTLSKDQESAPLLEIVRAIERSLLTTGQSAMPSLFVIAPHLDSTQPCETPDPPGSGKSINGLSHFGAPRSVAPRGGLAPGVKRRICEHIDGALARPFVLSDLAAMAKLSTYHFARAFKQSLGVPPHRYVIQRRIATAAELVKTTNHPLSAIAIDVGFSDQSHFTRLFARQMGEAPRVFRRRHR